MNCSNQMLYTIQYGDTLYNLALRYNTTVDDIMGNNASLNPYNLIVGSQIVLCPNSKNSTVITTPALSPNGLKLITEMNSLWTQHVFWTRLFLISVAEDLKDLEFTKKRLLRNPSDIANVYRRYYEEEIANRIEQLLTEHLVIGGDLIVALKNGNTALASDLSKRWYKNADDMSEYFSSFNPFYDKEDLRKMFYTHLQLTTQEVSARLAKDYAADIAAFDMAENVLISLDLIFYLVGENGKYTHIKNIKNFTKHFPGHKAKIEAFAIENDIRFNNKEDLISLFEFCIKL